MLFGVTNFKISSILLHALATAEDRRSPATRNVQLALFPPRLPFLPVTASWTADPLAAGQASCMVQV